MLFEALICTSAQLSQQFLADESLLRHYVSPSEDLYSHKISEVRFLLLLVRDRSVILDHCAELLTSF